MTFHLRIYENNHYGDESEAYDHGSYGSYKTAVKAAKAIVDEFFLDNWKKGMPPNELCMLYGLYGDDPAILPNEPEDGKMFSASDYARDYAAKFCEEMEKNIPGS